MINAQDKVNPPPAHRRAMYTYGNGWVIWNEYSNQGKLVAQWIQEDSYHTVKGHDKIISNWRVIRTFST